MATSPNEKAKLLTLHFATRGRKKITDPYPDTEAYLQEEENPPPPITTVEVTTALYQMNSRSAPGRDSITVPTLKNLPSSHPILAK